MFFFGPQNLNRTSAPSGNALFEDNVVINWGFLKISNEATWLFDDLDSFIHFLPTRTEKLYKVDVIGYFAHAKEFYVNLLLISFWNLIRLDEFIKNSLQNFIEGLLKGKIILLQKQILTILSEQNKIIGNIKALFPPLDKIPNSLHPIKIAA